MAFSVDTKTVEGWFPDYTVITALAPSQQKAAFLVEDKHGERYCLKIISPEYEIDRVKREILALQLLDNPNIVKLRSYTFSLNSGNELHYMIEEYIEGQDLSQIMASGQLISWK